MKPLSLLTTQPVLLLFQITVSTWFLIDFFLARDSLTANSLWRTKYEGSNETIATNQQLHLLAEKVREKHCSRANPNAPPFDKVVFVVIDALGTEFISSMKKDDTGSPIQFSMPFLEQLIRDKNAIAFTGKAATPTVTMPRIKALLSGTIPSFLDLMYNLASDVSRFDDDNILRIAKLHNKSMVFYGDDTWLSLFDRRLFIRSQETFSKFAYDYTQVDTNVTELALPETQPDSLDWDYLFLHYLGLDHIGHLSGTNNDPLIGKKLLEMDKVIEGIYKNMKRKTNYRTVMIVCGDHGMSAQGNHGGGSRIEVDTLMAFIPINNHQVQIKNSKPSETVQQIDMAVTLALLTNLPIPFMSRGVAIKDLLESFMNIKELSCAFLLNLMQLVRLKGALDLNMTSELTRLLELQTTMFESDLQNLTVSYFKFSQKIQNDLLEVVASNSNPILILIALVAVTSLTLIDTRRSSIKASALNMPIFRYENLICILICFIPIIMPGSTDFIEFEYFFWPIYSLSNLVVLCGVAIYQKPDIVRKVDPIRIGTFVVTFLLTSTWNYAHILRDNKIVPIIALVFLCNSLRQNNDFRKNLRKISFLSIGALLLLTHCLEEEPSILEQRLVLLVVLLYTILNLLSRDEEQYEQIGKACSTSVSRLLGKLASSWLLFSFLLLRRYNFMFLVANVIMEASLNAIIDSLKLSIIARALLYVHFAQASFYNQGNSNLFTSIDVKPAFYGQTSYNLLLAIPLCMLATYSSQIYWYLKMYQRIQNEKSILFAGDFINSRNYLCLSYYMFVCIVLRNHLFIWSVISPKLIYQYVGNNVLLMTTLLVQNLNKLQQNKKETGLGSKDSIN